MKRLNKRIAQAGIASRRKADELILAGKVTVNGKVVKEVGTLVPDGAVVHVAGRLAKEEYPAVYLLHKPIGYHCTSDPTRKPKRAIDLIKDNKRLFTVGRLDKDTSGLIIITNDGHLAQRIIHPSMGVKKEYLVKTDSEITTNHIKELLEGTKIDGDHIKPLKVAKVRRGTFKIVVADGKKHEVRLLCEQAGLRVLELKRIRVGHLVLGNLPIGSYRELSDEEIDPFLA